MTHDDQPLVRIQFLVCARRHIAHGHQHTAADPRRLKFPRFAHIDEPGLLLLEQGGGFHRRDFVVQHQISVPVGLFPVTAGKLAGFPTAKPPKLIQTAS